MDKKDNPSRRMRRVDSAGGSGPTRGTDNTRATVTNEAELEHAIKLTRRPSVDDVLSLADETPSAPMAAPTRARGETGSIPKETTAPTRDALSIRMQGCLSLGDYSGALELADLILRTSPDDAEAVRVQKQCSSKLEQMYLAVIGPLSRCPIVRVETGQLRWLSLDHRAGFLLSLMDGQIPYETVLELSGMPRGEALQILAKLVEKKVISPR